MTRKEKYTYSPEEFKIVVNIITNAFNEMRKELKEKIKND